MKLDHNNPTRKLVDRMLAMNNAEAAEANKVEINLEELSLLDAVRNYITAKERVKAQADKQEDGETETKLEQAFEHMVTVCFREMNTLHEYPAEKQEMLMLENVRDLLGKALDRKSMQVEPGYVKMALDYVEGVMNNDESLGRLMEPFSYIGAFESSFKTAMRKHNLIAGFVVIEPIRKADNTYTYRMLTGGHHVADAALSYHLRPLADALGQNIGPKRDFTDIQEIVRRAALNPGQVGK